MVVVACAITACGKDDPPKKQPADEGNTTTSPVALRAGETHLVTGGTSSSSKHKLVFTIGASATPSKGQNHKLNMITQPKPQ